MSRRARSYALVATFLLAPSAASGAETPGSAPTATARAKPHFDNGVSLYQDGNFAGALAEFEAAYRIKPGASSLQNVALCQKALFRYGEAAVTLQTLLAQHGSELDGAGRAKVQTAIDELLSLVGSIRLVVTPPDARVTIDGRLIEAKDGMAQLNVGEHHIVAEAPGFARASRAVRIAGGQEGVLVELALRPVTGSVSITAKHPRDAIAIDGIARAFGAWQGRLEPGRHYVQIYRPGHTTHEEAFVVAAGDERRFEPPPLTASTDPMAGAPGPLRPSGPPPQQRGWYALASLSALGPPRGAADDLEHDDKTDGSGASAGVRAGYRLFTPVAVEALIEGGPIDISKACVKPCTRDVRRNYTVRAVRLGGNVRYMSSGDSIRFASTLGVGAVRHTVEIESATGDPDPALEGGEAAGTDPYFLVELGGQLNLGHVLLEAGLAMYVEGTDNIRGSVDGAPRDTLYTQDGLVMVGLNLKAGWGEWRPTPARSRPAVPR